jgi:endonuclease YncB( thermonuclease family)
MAEPYVYENVQLVRAIDGDTVELKLQVTRALAVDFGFHVLQTAEFSTTVQMNFRLMGIDTPEIVGEQRVAGLKAKDRLLELLSSGKRIRATTFKPDKFGRWLVKLDLLQEDGVSWQDVNATLIEEGLAKPYLGGTRT